MTYAAYLRIYEPLSAFHEPQRSMWAAYANSASRPRRRDTLAAEHAEALHRMVAASPVAVPEQESGHAYIRSADGAIYVCPWQTRLRSVLAFGRLTAAGTPQLPGAFYGGEAERAATALAKLRAGRTAARLHILATIWTVPLSWFVLFSAEERWLALGPGGERSATATTASATRALVYATPMSRARRRVARGLAALRGVPSGFEDVAWEPLRMEAELAEVGRWLEDFHPYSLVELDYGGLVHLLSDEALRGDQSVAEIGAAIGAVTKGECELAVAMYKRAQGRWRTFGEFELAN